MNSLFEVNSDDYNTEANNKTTETQTKDEKYLNSATSKPSAVTYYPKLINAFAPTPQINVIGVNIDDTDI